MTLGSGADSPWRRSSANAILEHGLPLGNGHRPGKERK
jgi:hypothetical protein